MSRPILDEARVHPTIRSGIADYHKDIVGEVCKTIEENDFAIIGMKGNPHCRAARRLLDDAKVEHSYLEYGTYFGAWRLRLALKMWSGWPTFPMVFHKGTLLGGADNLKNLLQSGELK